MDLSEFTSIISPSKFGWCEKLLELPNEKFGKVLTWISDYIGDNLDVFRKNEYELHDFIYESDQVAGALKSGNEAEIDRHKYLACTSLDTLFQLMDAPACLKFVEALKRAIRESPVAF